MSHELDAWRDCTHDFVRQLGGDYPQVCSKCGHCAHAITLGCSFRIQCCAACDDVLKRMRKAGLL